MGTNFMDSLLVNYLSPGKISEVLGKWIDKVDEWCEKGGKLVCSSVAFA